MGTTGVSGQGGRQRRQVIIPEWRRHDLRLRLLALYRHDARYQELLASRLRPQWAPLRRSKIVNPYADVDDTPFANAVNSPTYSTYEHINLLRKRDRLLRQLEAGDQRVAPDYAALDRYLTDLRAVVGGELRLQSAGQPVEWAVDVLHDDVREAHGVERAPNYAPQTQHAAVHVLLSPRHADVLSTVGDTTAIDYAFAPIEGFGEHLPQTITTFLRKLVPLEQQPESRVIGPGPTRTRRLPVTVPLDGCRVEQDTVAGGDTSFDEWAALEERAVTLLRAAIGELRRDYQALYGQMANPSRLDDEGHDLLRLQRFLFHERESVPLLAYERRRVRAVADAIGIDLPRPSSRRRRDPE